MMITVGSRAPRAITKQSRQPLSYVDIEGVTYEYFPISTEQRALEALLTELYTDHWDGIQFGTLIQGAVWEISVEKPPERIGVLDGYLTVDFGHWHFHVCIGEQKGMKGRPIAPDLARIRRTSRAEFFRSLKSDGTPNCWGFQMYNGLGEIQMTVFFPNPYLSSDGKIRREADWTSLRTWDALRRRHAGLPADDKDRTSSGFVHG